MRRAVAQLPLLLLVLLLGSSASAQSNIPDGVFVRESNGTTWLVLKGQRISVPIWQATDADIAAIPTSDQWAVLSVNDSGAMVAGSKPAWLAAQEAAQSASPGPAAPKPSPEPPAAPQPTPAQSGPIAVSVLWAGFDPLTRNRFAASVTNQTNQTLEGVQIEYSGVDADGVIISSSTKRMPPLAPGISFPFVAGFGTDGAAASIRDVRFRVVSAGKPTSAQARLFTVESIGFEREASPLTRNATEYKIWATVTSDSSTATRYDVQAIVLLKDAAGNVVGGDIDLPSNIPDSLTPGTKFRFEDRYVPASAAPASAEVIVYAGPRF